MNHLIIWDKETEVFLDDFADAGEGDVIVLDQSQIIKMENGSEAETLENVYSNLQSENPTKYSAVIILAELGWDRKHLQNFYGVEVAQELRGEHSFLGPVVICSSFNETVLQNYNQTSVEFINAVGTNYCHITELKELNNRNFESIDEDTLLDIKENCIDQFSIINTVIHDLKNKFIDVSKFNNEGTKKKDIENAVSFHFDRLYSHFDNETKLIEKYKNDFINAIYENTCDTIITNTLDQLKISLISLLPADFAKGEKKQYGAKWKILFLDDEKNVRELIEKKFSERGLNCKTVSNYEELENELKTDEKNNWYTVLICDYRLKDKNGEKWQTKQGYAVLKEVFLNKTNYLSLFALSSMDSKILLKFRERHKMKVSTFSKEDVKTESGFNIFCAKVYEEGEKMFDTICGLPGEDAMGAWKKTDNKKSKRDKPFKDYYRTFRMLENFEEEEIRIGKTAEEYYYKVREEKIDNHNFEFTAALLGKDEEKKLNKFKNKLVGRRIFLALRFPGTISNPIKLWYLMNKKPVYNEEQYKPGGPDTSMFSQHLCMPEDFEEKPIMLTEERYWLKNDMSYNIDEANREAFNVIYDVFYNYWNDNDVSITTYSTQTFQLLVKKFKKGVVYSLKNLEDILKLLQKIENKNIHKEKIIKKIIQEISDIRKETKYKSSSIRFNAQKLLDQLSISGVLSLLNKYGFKPMAPRAEPIKTGNKKSKNKPLLSAQLLQKDSKSYNEDYDPTSSEGKARLRELDTSGSLDIDSDNK